MTAGGGAPPTSSGRVASALDLRGDWAALLQRRPGLASSLAVPGAILQAWATWVPAAVVPLTWSAGECAARWQRGLPLLAEAPLPCPPAALESLLGEVMEVLAARRTELAPALQAFAEAWDRGETGIEALLRAGQEPVGGGRGALPVTALLGVTSLRPALQPYLAGVHPHLADGAWPRGQCPFCGAPPAWADVLEDGQRRLACLLCGAGWRGPRLACPVCARDGSGDLLRLQAEGSEEGYAIAACRGCGAYVKELDRRVRWNAGPPLVEDWGSPHLDLVARRAGYRRLLPVPMALLPGDS